MKLRILIHFWKVYRDIAELCKETDKGKAKEVTWTDTQSEQGPSYDWANEVEYELNSWEVDKLNSWAGTEEAVPTGTVIRPREYGGTVIMNKEEKYACGTCGTVKTYREMDSNKRYCSLPCTRAALVQGEMNRTYG